MEASSWLLAVMYKPTETMGLGMVSTRVKVRSPQIHEKKLLVWDDGYWGVPFSAG